MDEILKKTDISNSYEFEMDFNIVCEFFKYKGIKIRIENEIGKIRSTHFKYNNISCFFSNRDGMNSLIWHFHLDNVNQLKEYLTTVVEIDQEIDNFVQELVTYNNGQYILK
jgi:CRISPR/Cas system Type II protein with McrA/HNH and RuvC-like nuclease domain